MHAPNASDGATNLLRTHMTTYRRSHMVWGFRTVAALIRRNLLRWVAGGPPVVAHVVRLAPPSIVPKRVELTFGIRFTLGLAKTARRRMPRPQSLRVPLIFLDKAQRVGCPGFDQLKTG